MCLSPVSGAEHGELLGQCCGFLHFVSQICPMSELALLCAPECDLHITGLPGLLPSSWSSQMRALAEFEGQQESLAF